MSSDVAELFSYGDAPVFLFVDHASNAVPAQFANLGLEDDVLAQHMGWDIGAEALARALAAQLKGKVLCCRFSRLLIDPNRAPENPGLIPGSADNVVIPGNQTLSQDARQRRIDEFYQPYHDYLSRALDDIQSTHIDPLIVSVHSFTPQLSAKSDKRPWHISKLWKDDAQTAEALMQILRAETGYVIGDNEPYSGQEYNFTVDKNVGPRGLRHTTFEVRQDLISDDTGVQIMGETIGNAIAKIL